jgi:uncharacterized protein (DUF697 family)
MSSLSLIEAAYNLAVATDKATDIAVHEKVAGIVKLHAKLAIASAWIPIPGADLAAMAGNTWTMYVRINKTLDIPFSKNLIKSLSTGIGTNILSSLPVLGVASVLKWFPGIGTLGSGAIMSVPVYIATISAGIVYMKALAVLLKRKSELTEVNLKEALDSILDDKNGMKQIITDAKREYVASKASGELKGSEVLK